MTRIILADDDPIVLHGLSMIVSAGTGIELLGTACDGAQAVELCRQLKPDVAVLDIRMPGTDGIKAAEIILQENLCHPLLLTTFDEPELINRALETGAKGYILKTSPAEQILSAIETVAKGGTVFAPDVLDYIRTLAKPARNRGFTGLSPREREVAELVAKGLSNAEIAATLFLSNGTVRNHISVILEKMNLEHRTQIAVQYYAGG